MERRLNNVMLDIETLDTEAGAVMLSLAAVQFDEHTGETGAEFYQKISLQNSIDLGLTINADTLKWWLDKDRKVLNEALSGTKSLAEVLVDFRSWFNSIKLQHDKVSIWGNSARFDCGIVEAAYKKVNINIPWDSWLEVCFRTFIRKHKDLRKSIPFVGSKHLPIDDCKHQISTVVAINNLKK